MLSPGGDLAAGRAGLGGHASCMVPGCGEERIPSGGPLGVAGEEYRVTPVARLTSGAGILTCFPFAPGVSSSPPRPVPGRLVRPPGTAGTVTRPGKILTGGLGPADPGADTVAQETYSTSDPKDIAWVIATSTKICSAGGFSSALASPSRRPGVPSYSSPGFQVRGSSAGYRLGY